MMASPPVFLSTLLSDVTRVESVEIFFGWTGIAFFLGVLAEELEAFYKKKKQYQCQYSIQHTTVRKHVLLCHLPTVGFDGRSCSLEAEG